MIRVVLKDIVEKPITGEWGNEGTSVKVLRTTNFTNEGFIDYSKVVKRDIEQKKINTKRLFKGDLIIEKSGGSPTQPVGRVVYFDSDDIFLCNNFTAILRPKKEQVFPKYLHFILFVGHQFGLTSTFQNKTTGIINLQLTKYLEGTKIPLPPLVTQKKIAAILDEADKLRQLDKKLIEKYDALTQSLFLDMFGDFVLNPYNFKQITIGELCPEKYSIVCGPFGTQLKIGEYVEDGIPVYGIDNIAINNFIDAKPKFITDSKYIQLKAFIVKHKDILITRTGTVGRTCLAPNIDKAVIGPNLLKIRIQNNEVDPVYLAFAFNYSPSIKKQIKMFSPGATVAVYNTGNLKKLKVLVPPISLQNQFKETFHIIETQKDQAQKSLQKSETLFNSLLQKAFKGELV